MGRFINADGVVSTGQGFMGCNMFAYCLNNPAAFFDNAGTRPTWYEWNINGGVTAYNDAKTGRRTVDITKKLTDFMIDNVSNIKEYKNEHGYIAAAWYFRENVNDGGSLDIKVQEGWVFQEETVYIFKGKQLRFDDPGNINFGYVGAVLFPETILCFGAGINQISNHGFAYGGLETFYDDPRDTEMIKYGYTLYWEGLQ